MDSWQKLLAVNKTGIHDEDGSPQLTCTPKYVKEIPGETPRDPVIFFAQGGGRRIPLLKTMLTTACKNDCNYCAFRQQRDIQRYAFSPDEMASVFMQMANKRKVEGIFLSSGIPGSPITCQDRLLDTIAIIRERYHYRGYVHLKIMPGADDEQLRQSLKYADRLSINIEAANALRLKDLAPSKQFDDVLLATMKKLAQLIRDGKQDGIGKVPSLTTQIVTGAVGESDMELMAISQALYQHFKLARVYYSRFEPIENTPLEGNQPLDYTRYVRIYQASFLLRDYGFDMEEIPFGKDGNLPLNDDPKLAWARLHYSDAPVELNRLGKEELLRLPGIGPLGADRIYNFRKQHKITSLKQLDSLGVVTARLAPFILLDGHKIPHQYPLWKTPPSISLEKRSR